MNIQVSDPLSLLVYQSGLSGDELKEEAAKGNTSLDERRIYLRKSNDLINWSEPQKINIENEFNDITKSAVFSIIL